jgi:hypothetical protein
MRKLRWQLLIVLLALTAIGVLLLSQETTVLQPFIRTSTGQRGVYQGLIGSFAGSTHFLIL